jgi:hypothetical protein
MCRVPKQHQSRTFRDDGLPSTVKMLREEPGMRLEALVSCSLLQVA